MFTKLIVLVGRRGSHDWEDGQVVDGHREGGCRVDLLVTRLL